MKMILDHIRQDCKSFASANSPLLKIFNSITVRSVQTQVSIQVIKSPQPNVQTCIPRRNNKQPQESHWSMTINRLEENILNISSSSIGQTHHLYFFWMESNIIIFTLKQCPNIHYTEYIINWLPDIAIYAL